MVVVTPAKLYAMGLETRASRWAEHCKGRTNGQAGFQKDDHTPDELAVIQDLVRQDKQQKRKLYCRFVDFYKSL